MKRGFAISLIAFAGFGFHTNVLAENPEPEIADEYAVYFESLPARRAQQNWMLNCQGCHKADGSGHGDLRMPDLRHQVSRFLAVDRGREYLSRVPGVTNTPLSDQELAELLDWVLITFDPEHLPSDFETYKAEEVAKWRKMPLSLEASDFRAELMRALDKTSNKINGE